MPVELLIEACEDRGDHVQVLAFDSKRHVGSRIGIYNFKGDKVGTPGPSRNTEYLILSGEKDRVRHMVRQASKNDGTAPVAG